MFVQLAIFDYGLVVAFVKEARNDRWLKLGDFSLETVLFVPAVLPESDLLSTSLRLGVSCTI
jgi:hypothetical protein